MSLFYAYAKNDQDHNTYRYLITFASRSVADEWWRAVQDSVTSSYKKFADAKRVTPQFYTHKPGVGNLYQTVTDPQCAPRFLGKVFFTLLNDHDGRNFNIAPPIDITDHISGKTYYIRSKHEPSKYWYLGSQCLTEGSKPSQVVQLSSTVRTRFRIKIRVADGSSQDGKIMIGSDDIYISVPGVMNNADVSNINTASDNGALVAGRTADIFKFHDFENGFIVAGAIGDRGGESSNVWKHEFGQKWELVA
ncbi:hypothetical protein FPQ18DRAFT_323469 [Pyronema domesticum]|uniref:Uncharacterized protein n=1 Tax=Pyronema omphalodes (strain CBS 100304) TaxID=1076935 RepID=U4KYA1_PYROM|nr:hypothetical protein FPQ18DRAFT_323469 [Pyronema domesticum]CCX07192.1 Similar to predicted protein [Laccaria bicolor S238N-H82]; acc. no. XP_001878005 [Pyronema omphalodes CBS 100304]